MGLGGALGRVIWRQRRGQRSGWIERDLALRSSLKQRKHMRDGTGDSKEVGSERWIEGLGAEEGGSAGAWVSRASDPAGGSPSPMMVAPAGAPAGLR